MDDSGVDKDAETITVNIDNYNDVINSLIRQRDSMATTIERYEPQQAQMDAIVKQYKDWGQNLEKTLEVNEAKTKQLNKEFFNKYSRYIQEGTWISEDFTDANLYYFAAQSVSNTSAFPQVQYTINVIDVSADEDYRNYKFNIGDKTYIEDVEFFGYVPDTKRPYQEEVVITEMVYNLDNPGDNTIKVKNYKTQFEDLFQRVAAATQSLQYAEGKYARASNAIKEDGTIDGSVLERTLNLNYCLADAISKEIAEGGEVITLQAITDPNRIVKMSGLGIELSNTGGQDWRTAITADGINADVGVFGSLHTNNLKIYNGDDESFFWDANGITAYGIDPDSGATIYNKFVRMNKDGIFGYAGNQANEYAPIDNQKIIDDSVFSLTWQGLSLQNINGNNYVRLSTPAVDNEETVEYIKINYDEDSFDTTETYYIKEGENYIRVLSHGANNTDEFVYKNGEVIGFTKKVDLYRKNILFTDKKKVIWAGDKQGDNFIVYEDGSIYANNGHFQGTINAVDGVFSGTITASKLVGSLECMKGSVIVGKKLGIGENATIKDPSLGHFYVDEYGNVDMTGSIYIEGSINIDDAGEIGYVTGLNSNFDETEGIGIMAHDGEIVITDGGARMSYDGDAAVVTTPNSASLIYGDNILRVNDKRIAFSMNGEKGPWTDIGGGGVAIFG